MVVVARQEGQLVSNASLVVCSDIKATNRLRGFFQRGTKSHQENAARFPTKLVYWPFDAGSTLFPSFFHLNKKAAAPLPSTQPWVHHPHFGLALRQGADHAASQPRSLSRQSIRHRPPHPLRSSNILRPHSPADRPPLALAFGRISAEIPPRPHRTLAPRHLVIRSHRRQRRRWSRCYTSSSATATGRYYHRSR